MRGALAGLSLSTTRADCIRAILEGVAYMLRQSVQVVSALGMPVREIRSVGGAAVSPLWNRIKASVTQLPVVAMRESESTALGAAMLGAMGMGVTADPAEIRLDQDRVYLPEAEWIGPYERGFARFETINRRLSGLRVDMEGQQ